MWDVLRIEPTRDLRVIRRAYAAKARQVHADTDPAGFMRLREAYEAAVRWAEGETSELETPPGLESGAPPFEVFPEQFVTQRAPGSPGAAVVATAELAAPDAEATAFDDAFRAAKAVGRLDPLLRVFQGGLSRGLVPLGHVRPRLIEVVRTALVDPTLDLEAMERLEGPLALTAIIPELPGDLVACWTARRDAEAWWRRTQRERRKNLPLFGSRAARVAWMLLGHRLPWLFRRHDETALREGLAELRRHGPQLLGRVSLHRADRLERRMMLWLHPTPRQEFLIYMGLLAFLIAFWIGLEFLPGLVAPPIARAPRAQERAALPVAQAVLPRDGTPDHHATP